MTTTTEPTTEEALWRSVGSDPADALPRLVLADWYEERAGSKTCVRCRGGRLYCPRCSGEGCSYYGMAANGPCLVDIECEYCSGTGVVSNGFADLAAALLATADRVPISGTYERRWSWMLVVDTIPHLNSIPRPLFDHLGGVTPRGWPSYRDYPTAEAAVRDLCRAWVKVNRGRG